MNILRKEGLARLRRPGNHNPQSGHRRSRSKGKKRADHDSPVFGGGRNSQTDLKKERKYPQLKKGWDLYTTPYLAPPTQGTASARKKGKGSKVAEKQSTHEQWSTSQLGSGVRQDDNGTQQRSFTLPTLGQQVEGKKDGCVERARRKTTSGENRETGGSPLVVFDGEGLKEDGVAKQGDPGETRRLFLSRVPERRRSRR